MKCQLIQTTKIDDTNLAEREMLKFLQNLPGNYYIYRELKLTPAYLEQVHGIDEQKPDFVIVNSEVGLVSIETKDWNLFTNTYEWRDQYKIKKISKNGNANDAVEIDNPVEQISRYEYGFRELFNDQGIKFFVTSLLAFPRVSRAEFINRLSNVQILQNPQSKFYLDLEQTIFKEDLDRYFLTPDKLLLKILAKSNRRFNYSNSEVEAVNRTLLPSKFIIGDFSRRQANRQELRILSERQQNWIFGVERDVNYLLDVPGSGKTNALVSKAIHTVDQDHSSSLRVLITTYSKNLETNIKRIFEHKIIDMPSRQRYQRAIRIQCVPDLLENVLASIYSLEEIEKQRSDKLGFDSWVRKNVAEILNLDPDRFRIYDEIFVDEIQDFDNFYLLALDHFCRNKRFFFVGDIGQKIYERRFDLERLGILPHCAELPKDYKMYRTPHNISKLAVNFVWGDAHCRKDFEENGYHGNFKYPNKLDFIAQILRTNDPASDIAKKIQEFLLSTYSYDDVLIIASSKMMGEIGRTLENASIPFKKGEPESEGFIALVDFQEAKGLEREIVVIAGIEDLFDQTKPEGQFWEEEQKIVREGLSRRMIYVALTRTIEQLIIFYRDPLNSFVADLLKANEKILSDQRS